MSPPMDETTIRTQRRAADPARSAWVSANAGAGKTRVLTERVARLLLANVDPGRILCLTFTKAAAAEMLHRLFAMLADWAILPRPQLENALEALTGRRPDVDQIRHARALFAYTLDASGGLRIQTIHSFCQDLLARFPLEAGVPPGFDVQDERTAGELLNAARDEVFRSLNGEGDNRVQLRTHLTRHFSEPVLMQFLREITGKRGRFHEALMTSEGIEPLLELVRDRLGIDRDATPETLITAALDNSAFAIDDLRKAAQVLSRGSKKERDTADAMHGLLAANDRVPHFDRYREAFFTKSGSPRANLLNKGTGTAHPDVALTLETEQLRLIALDEACRSARIAQMTEAALTFADEYFNTYERMKRERTILDYEDLILKSREMLTFGQSADWILYKLDQSIDHVLIDEAQDTGPEPWEIITRLTEDFFAGEGIEKDLARTVFAVGDEKQSIYGFQGAAPELFQETARTIGARAQGAGLSWSEETLDLSFRSLPTILEAVDHVFAGPGAASGLTFDGKPVSHRAWRTEGNGLVEIWPIIKPNKTEDRPAWNAPLDRPTANDPSTLLAARIADTVQGWFENGDTVHTGHADTPHRPMCPGDILILVRSRNRLVDEMIRAFRERSIPVAGTDRLSLTDHIAVMDLMAAGDVALLPEDDLTLAILLKSPFCGLDDDALFALAHDRQESLWQVMRNVRGIDDLLSVARDFVHWLNAHRNLRPFDFFSRLLTEKAGRAKLLSRLGPDAADPIEEFLNQTLAFERTHTPTLQGFLRWLRSTSVDVKRDMDQTADEIRIMTVHGAKGLQSNVVILPDTCSVPDARHDPSLLPIPLDRGPVAETFLVIPAKSDDCPLSAEARAAYTVKRDAEFRRLLYVALTRARDRLYVCGFESAARARPDGCWYNLVRDALEPHGQLVPGEFGEDVLRLGETPPRLQKNWSAGMTRPTRLPSWAEHPPESRETTIRRLSPSALAVRDHLRLSDLTGRVASGGDAARRGNLIHRMLELLPEIEPSEREAAAGRYLDRSAADLPLAGRAELIRETLLVIDDSRFAAAFGPGSLAEVPIAGTLPELGSDVVVDGRIDRLLVTETCILAVDFKTGTPPASEAAVPVEYLTQMAAYRALLLRIYPGREVNCALLWTRAPALMELSAGAMKSVLTDAARHPAPP